MRKYDHYHNPHDFEGQALIVGTCIKPLDTRVVLYYSSQVVFHLLASEAKRLDCSVNPAGPNMRNTPQKSHGVGIQSVIPCYSK